MRENLYGRILKGEPNEQHLSTIPKSCFFFTKPQKQLPKKKKKRTKPQKQKCTL